MSLAYFQGIFRHSFGREGRNYYTYLSRQRCEEMLLRLLVSANVVPISPILVIMMMEAIRSYETYVLKKLHGITSHNTAFLIATAVKTSNVTWH
jgi:hypothetical protein